MRYGIFSDVHSNLDAFVAVLDFFKKKHIDKYVFVGDIVGYGAEPCEAIALLKTLRAVCIAGNHDWAVAGKFDDAYFNIQAKASLVWTQKRLASSERNLLRRFSVHYEEDRFECTHGSLYMPEHFNYVLNINDARINFSLLKKQLLFVGHSHKLQAYRQDKTSIAYIPDSTIDIVPGEKYIINVGSVGQPRDRDVRAGCCIYDSDENTVTCKRLEYPIKKAADKILAAGLPEMLATRLYLGW